MHHPEQADERDGLIAAKASRNASFVLGLGVFTATMLLMMPAPLLNSIIHFPQNTLVIDLLVLTAAVGEFTRFSSQIVYYRRGA